jgi:CrcB protein
LIGFLGGLAETRQLLGTSQRLFLFTGVLGGFTTFSSFAYDTLRLGEGPEPLKAVANVACSVVLGLGAAWLGFLAARHV